MSEQHHDHHASEAHAEHPHVNYAKIYYILLGLFLLSVIGPEITNNKALILIFAFGIAVVKAIMVAGYFMHLAHEKKYIWYAFITSLGLLFLFIMAVAPDIMKANGQNWHSTIIVKEEDGLPKHHEDHAHVHENGESATEHSKSEIAVPASH
jgi:caa(3)-type oxidase subunit IV